MTRGCLIVFEGGDRSGKSTQVSLLQEFLNLKNIPVKLRRFPDRTTWTGQIIDSYLKQTHDMHEKAIHLLFSANRWESIQEIERELMQGTTVLMDRYAYSGVAYSTAKNLDLNWCKACDEGLLKPDLVLYLDASPQTAAKRQEFGLERFETIDFQTRVRDAFMQLQGNNWKLIDASNSIDDIHQQIQSLVMECLSRPMKPLETLWT